MLFKKLAVIILIFLIVKNVSAQEATLKKGDIIDSTYIQTFPKQIMGRIYTSRKFTKLTFQNKLDGSQLKYEPNTTLNFGVGATVKSFTLNLAYGFKFLNKEGLKKGKTQYLDLQSYIYKRKFMIDVYGQFYNGLYLANSGYYFKDTLQPYYLRNDIKIRLFGFRALRVNNSSRFSYSAPFVQNELQKKSAGSFLYGLAAVAFSSSADSNYVPHFIKDSLYKSYYNLKEMQVLQIGPDVGYAYSLIIKQRFFTTLSVDLSFMIGPVKYHPFQASSNIQWQVNPALSARFAIGYNSPNWFLGFTALQGTTSVKSFDKNGQMDVGIGNVRLYYVKRFTMGKKMSKKVNDFSIF